MALPSPKQQHKIFVFFSRLVFVLRTAVLEMTDFSREIDWEKLVSFSDDLVKVMRDKKDINKLTFCLQQFQALQLSCDSDFAEVQKLLQGPAFIVICSIYLLCQISWILHWRDYWPIWLILGFQVPSKLQFLLWWLNCNALLQC